MGLFSKGAFVSFLVYFFGLLGVLWILKVFRFSNLLFDFSSHFEVSKGFPLGMFRP